MLKRILYSLIVFVLFLNFSLLAEEPEKDEEPEKLSHESSAEPGFVKGAFYFSIWLGASLAPPDGSFIRHEKLYDETRNLEILQGQLGYIQPFESWVAVPSKNSYTSGGVFGFSFDYALSRFIGTGFSFFSTNVWAERHNTFRDPRDGRLYLIPFELDDDYQLGLSALSLDLGLHILPSKAVDPFIKFHGGPAFASGRAHQTFTKDFYKYNERIHNGRGFVYGASLGCNFYFDQRAAIQAEVKYLRYDFHADELSNRTFYNTFLSIGFLVKG
ncbi:MAG: hypothetical protein OEZ34_15825, partial [Spirochaetia bacterium]|nr:hypothetical protein [Spirochaetia bacterium]